METKEQYGNSSGNSDERTWSMIKVAIKNHIVGVKVANITENINLILNKCKNKLNCLINLK